MKQNTPLIIETKTLANGDVRELAAHDVLELKLLFYVGLAGVLGKIVYDWWTKKDDKTSEQLEMLVKAHHTDQVRLENMESILEKLSDEMIKRHELTDIVRSEIEWVNRVKRQ